MSAATCEECRQPVRDWLRRGRCPRCYQRAYWRHRHHDAPLPGQRQRQAREDVLDNYRVLRCRGLDTAQIAEQLGITEKHLRRTLRAADREDTA